MDLAFWQVHTFPDNQGSINELNYSKVMDAVYLLGNVTVVSSCKLRSNLSSKKFISLNNKKKKRVIMNKESKSWHSG